MQTRFFHRAQNVEKHSKKIVSKKVQIKMKERT